MILTAQLRVRYSQKNACVRVRAKKCVSFSQSGAIGSANRFPVAMWFSRTEFSRKNRKNDIKNRFFAQLRNQYDEGRGRLIFRNKFRLIIHNCLRCYDFLRNILPTCRADFEVFFPGRSFQDNLPLRHFLLFSLTEAKTICFLCVCCFFALKASIFLRRKN